MELIKWRPKLDLIPRIENVFDDLLSNSFMSTLFSDTVLEPKVDITEDDKEISISAEIPGIKKKDIEVTYKDGYLTISGNKKEEKEEKGKDYYKAERRYGRFCRSFQVPDYVEPDKISAKYSKGVLKIRLPKNKEALPAEIPVKVE